MEHPGRPTGPPSSTPKLQPRSWERARGALASRDFRLLLATRLLSQVADGFFQAFLVAQLVFLNPEENSTASGVAAAYALLIIPFSVIGPLAGVLIDRWSRRRILTLTPLVRAVGTLAVIPISGTGALLYVPTIGVVSLNRFFLATASAATPGLVQREHLLVANSMATVGGTVATFTGLVAGTKLEGILGVKGLLVIAAVCWPVAAFFASRIAARLRADRAVAPIRTEVTRVLIELRAGARRLVATPRALGPVVSVSLDQFLVGFVTVLSLVVFKEQFRAGVGSYGNIIAAGGVGILIGTITVSRLEPIWPKPIIVAVAFAIAGVACLAVAPALTGLLILVVSFVLGLTFAWRKVPVDTLVQESIPDRYRGRVFSIYDLSYAMARVVAAVVAVPVIPLLSPGWLLAAVGAVYLLWSPLVPWWTSRPQRLSLRFYEGGRAEEVPRAVSFAGEEQQVEVERSWVEERDGIRRRRFRLRLPDGSRMEVASDLDGNRWVLERELPSVVV
ncbi:MAG TPA: MFS transporter [Actinomycetota bacterium]|nr:MFS transporter [Actinomycetota bacterium]